MYGPNANPPSCGFLRFPSPIPLQYSFGVPFRWYQASEKSSPSSPFPFYKITIPEIDSPDEFYEYIKMGKYLETLDVDMYKLEWKIRDAREELLERAERWTRNAKARKNKEKAEQYWKDIAEKAEQQLDKKCESTKEQRKGGTVLEGYSGKGGTALEEQTR